MKTIKRRLDRMGKTAVTLVTNEAMARRAAMSPEEQEGHTRRLMGKLKDAVATRQVTIEQVRERWPTLVRKYFDENTNET